MFLFLLCVVRRSLQVGCRFRAVYALPACKVVRLISVDPSRRHSPTARMKAIDERSGAVALRIGAFGIRWKPHELQLSCNELQFQAVEGGRGRFAADRRKA
jgi:hypothetical protein